MEYSFRWFGPKDVTTLDEIRQIGVSGVVSSLSEIKYGKKWPYESIKKRKAIIEKYQISKNYFLKWNVVESLPVHNDIKMRSGKYKYFIDQYKFSLRNLAKNNIKNICYNFMPLIDWVRTDLKYQLPNGAYALRYDHLKVCAFENFVLNLESAKKRYSDKQIYQAKVIIKNMNLNDFKILKNSLLGGLAANDRKYSIKELKYQIEKFEEITHNNLRENLKEFIDEIFPILEEHNIHYNIHPDDPPYNIFGLPRIMSNISDINYITNLKKNNIVGITLCTGSLGVNKNNNLTKIIKKYGKYINFIHLRNIKRENNSMNFYETEHLDGDNDMLKIIKLILNEEKNRLRKKKFKIKNIPMRPDHGHTILHDKKKKIIPGYSLLGRMKGLDQLKGAIKMVKN